MRPHPRLDPTLDPIGSRRLVHKYKDLTLLDIIVTGYSSDLMPTSAGPLVPRVVTALQLQPDGVTRLPVTFFDNPYWQTDLQGNPVTLQLRYYTSSGALVARLTVAEEDQYFPLTIQQRLIKATLWSNSTVFQSPPDNPQPDLTPLDLSTVELVVWDTQVEQQWTGGGLVKKPNSSQTN